MIDKSKLIEEVYNALNSLMDEENAAPQQVDRKADSVVLSDLLEPASSAPKT